MHSCELVRTSRTPYNIFKGGSKIGLKCNKGVLITSELGGVPFFYIFAVLLPKVGE